MYGKSISLQVARNVADLDGILSVYVGFLTNAEVCNHLSSKKYRDNISIGIVSGIQAFMAKLAHNKPFKPD